MRVWAQDDRPPNPAPRHQRATFNLSPMASCVATGRHLSSSPLLSCNHFACTWELFFCFYNALRQWRRGNIALITTQPVPDCPNSVQHQQPRCLEDRFLPSHVRGNNRVHQHFSSSCRIVLVPQTQFSESTYLDLLGVPVFPTV